MLELLKRVVAVAIVELVLDTLTQSFGLGSTEARLLGVVMEELVESLLDRLFPSDRD